MGDWRDAQSRRMEVDVMRQKKLELEEEMRVALAAMVARRGASAR
jgi:uncharacterized protein YdcH (DUF465 family)